MIAYARVPRQGYCRRREAYQQHLRRENAIRRELVARQRRHIWRRLVWAVMRTAIVFAVAYAATSAVRLFLGKP